MASGEVSQNAGQTLNVFQVGQTLRFFLENHNSLWIQVL